MQSSPASKAAPLPLEPEHQRAEHSRKPSLLPAFEPLSSSPFPRPQSSKRKFNQDSPTLPKQQLKYYPTPVPTSSTGILDSSPQKTRPNLQRTISTLSERQPLGTVPTVHLPPDGDILRIGRSSNSSDYQLPANRLVSRVHVQAAYHAPTASYPHGYIEVECLGWNGAKIHCKGCVFELSKGDTYMSENPDAEVMLDVQETRVMIAWPSAPKELPLMWDSGDEVTPPHHTAADHLASSPPLIARSPVSQSPIRQPVFTAAPALPTPQAGPVRIFEDEDVGDGNSTPIPTSPIPEDETFIRPSQPRSNSAEERSVINPKASIMSSFNDDFSDGDEENDPVVHSFGPYGENLLPRLASFSTGTPMSSGMSSRRGHRAGLASASPQKSASYDSNRFKESPIKNHVINQLAYSRIHSQPLSAIHGNLPAELRAPVPDTSDKDGERSGSTTPVAQLSKQHLKQLLDDIPCVGEIPRSGKDAAGQPLENEFYYVPEMDSDMLRRESVSGGRRGAGLRSVRKQHKQYYWKKPRV